MQILHTMLRVGDLDRSIKFYQDVLGMRLLRTSENPEYKYTLAFLGYEDGESAAEIELTYNWGVDKYEQGTAYGHIAIGVDDIYAICDMASVSQLCISFPYVLHGLCEDYLTCDICLQCDYVSKSCLDTWEI
mgnify:CR=1 FL=1